jgi:hypothetical protein
MIRKFTTIAAVIVFTAVCSTAVSQALASPGLARASSAASVSSLSRQVSSLTTRVQMLERRVKLLYARHITVYTEQAPLMPAGTSFQTRDVDCPWGGTAIGGGVDYPFGGEHSSSVVLESAPTATNGWHGTVFSPQGDAAEVSVVCASLGWT